MTTNLESWSRNKQLILNDKLTDMWAEDIWTFNNSDCKNQKWHINFSCKSNSINTELKFACNYKFKNNVWSPKTRKLATFIHRIIKWLNKQIKNEISLMAKSCEKWIISFRTFLISEGRWHTANRLVINGNQELKTYEKEDECIYIFNGIYKVLQEYYDERPEYEKDIWDLRKLGYEINKATPHYKLNFGKIHQKWIKDVAKIYIKYNLIKNSIANSINKLFALNHFSEFLYENYPLIEASNIDRELIINYLSYISSKNISTNSKNQYVISLRNFLEICGKQEWGDITSKPLIYNEDLPQRTEKQPRFIPESVMKQLNEHLHELPLHIMRMVLIIQECGMRISELCTIPFNCLEQDSTGDWFLLYYQIKTKKEHRIPIKNEIVAIIQKQQHEDIKQVIKEPKYLFYDLKERIITRQVFSNALNKMAYNNKICDDAGELFRFKAHGFRHTVGTRMINNDVPQYIIQRYLGHECSRSTSGYAHILDQTLKKEFAVFKGKMIDVNGKIINDNSSPDNVELQWLKKNVMVQTLPNGYCCLPVSSEECPHANACLTCTHFRTDPGFLDMHKKQLESTEKIMKEAENKGWKRILEMNQKIKENLEHIISTLEGDENNT
ncbi:tyrosine-type recombinase/integrase [Clostridium lacusfryxellense]|uniref:tyrosine-type recombinase/integrase n=1 Tax=Clostridium lacusfryxellense TaxID=205328 RepID=UPI001C0C09A8|nr:tyrosine-type recombinase/integrase [Clostridium lacusfryxellense]MBU3114679.1 tyrosine-type recombinase/integrase [Clostridium lacusfryxellense]